MRMPVVFVGHGNPMNAIERNEYHLGWENLEPAEFFNAKVVSAISMTSVVIGGPPRR